MITVATQMISVKTAYPGLYPTPKFFFLKLLRNLLEGDPGDVYPAITENRKFDHFTNPSNKSYSGEASCVSLVSISDPKHDGNCDKCEMHKYYYTNSLS